MGFPNPIVEIAFNNASDETLYATQGWVQINPWVKTMSGPLRGRQYEVDRSEAGTFTVVLDNTDGEFTPGNPTSPFYPNIKANRRFRVRGKNMVAPNIGRGGGADQSTLFFERPTWADPSFINGVSEPVWKQHDPAAYPALPAELTDHIEVTVDPSASVGFRRMVSWIVPVEIGVRLTHSAYIWKVSGTEHANMKARFEIFYYDNDDIDLLSSYTAAELTRAMEEYSGGTPTTPSRKSFSHAPIGVAKYARVVWSVEFPSTSTGPVTYAITGIQSELPDNLAPNPNGDWDAMHWIGRGGNETPNFYSADRPDGGPTGGSNWVGFTWNGSVSLKQTIPHLIPGEWYAATAQVNLLDGNPAIIFTGDEGATGPQEFRFPNAIDTYDGRTLTGSWGSTSGGGIFGGGGFAYTLGGGGTGDVTASTGRLKLSTLDNPLVAGLASVGSHSDWDINFDFMLAVAPTGAAVEIGPDVTFPSNNDYGIQVHVKPDGTMDLYFRKNVNGIWSFPVSEPATQTFTAGTWYKVRMQKLGTRIRASLTLTTEAANWELETTDESHAAVAGYPAVRAKAQIGNTNALPVVVQVDNLRATQLHWVNMRTYFQAGGPQQDVEFKVPEDQDPTGKELLVRGLNVQRVLDTAVLLDPEIGYPQGYSTWERPKDIFEGWVERWPWKVDEDETTVVVVDRLKRVGVIELSNVVLETLQQDAAELIIPFNDDPTNNNGTLTWYGAWAQEASLAVASSKGDVLTSSYTLGVEGPTEEPAILWTPATSLVGYHIRLPYSPDYTTPPPPTAPPPPPSAPPPPTATQKTYTTTYYATWSRSYDSDGTTRWDDTPYLYHGCYFCSNNQRALVGFNWAAIKSDLSGASIVSIYFTMKNAHARWNNGLSTHVGTHNYSSKSGSWSGGTVRENRWKVFFKEMEKKSVSLGAGVGNEFKAGTTKGIAVGPAPSNITDNYGFFYGATQSNKPYLTITYKK